MNVGLISLIGIFVGILGLAYLVMKGAPLLVVGPVMSLVVLLFAMGSVDIIGGLTGDYSASFADFAKKNFLLFLLSSIFGKLTADCGAGRTIAVKMSGLIKKTGEKNKVLKTTLVIAAITAVLTMGGISSFVVIFTMISIIKPMYEEMDIPWHFSVAGVCLGAQVFTPTMIPGSPAVQNLIPMEYLGTTPTAAPMLGIACAITVILLCVIYLQIVIKRSAKKGEHFLPSGTAISKDDSLANIDIVDDEEGSVADVLSVSAKGSVIKALIPSIVLLIGLNVANLNPIVALALGNIVCVILFKNEFENLGDSITKGSGNAITALTSVCALVGFGGAVTAVPGFEFVVNGLQSIPGNPLTQLVLASNIMAGVTGSASGGLGIALDVFSERFLNMGIAPEVIHRVSAISAYGLDSMPFNSSIVNILSVTKLSHKQGYGHFFWLSLVIPVIVSFIAVIYVSIGII